MALLAALLVFLFFLVLLVGIWWVSQANRTVRERLRHAGQPSADTGILRADQEPLQGVGRVLGDTGLPQRLARLGVEAGYKATGSDLMLLTLACAAVGGAAAWI